MACGAVLGIPLAVACEALLRSVLMGPAAAGPADAIGVALLLMVLAFLACVLIVRESDLATLTAQLQRDT